MAEHLSGIVTLVANTPSYVAAEPALFLLKIALVLALFLSPR